MSVIERDARHLCSLKDSYIQLRNSLLVRRLFKNISVSLEFHLRLKYFSMMWRILMMWSSHDQMLRLIDLFAGIFTTMVSLAKFRTSRVSGTWTSEAIGLVAVVPFHFLQCAGKALPKQWALPATTLVDWYLKMPFRVWPNSSNCKNLL